ncbi:MAG: site-specific DNA-methyltransferase, partial [Armatimonadetes bacterium]|nr:site-specific DNA-methyltransferase [Candidatus Hippobium faecium]
NNGTQILKDIFNNKVFDYPKSVDLIKFLLSLINSRDSIVLDFFAGSGTTGQAVLDLNREDGGNRKFILCTNNDTDDVNLNGIAYDVTCERLKRVMTGEDYKGNSDFKWAEKNEPYGDNLLVCECETINNFSQIPGNNAFEKIDETLYDKEKMNDTDKIKWVCENFNLTCKYIEGEE